MDRSDASLDSARDVSTVRTQPTSWRSANPASRSEADVASNVVSLFPAANGPAARNAAVNDMRQAFGLSPLELRDGTAPQPSQPVIRAQQAAQAIPASASARWTGVVAKGLRWVAYLATAWAAIVLGLIVLYRFVDPPMSALMLQQRLSGEPVAHYPVPLSSISQNLVRAVLVSEDGRFCQHWGVDYAAMQSAIERANGGGPPRGASTISMQVAKNLFLWSSKSYVRKALEIPLTYVIEALWSKRRIMEVYLNVAEWGPGVFGVEAAARYHFNKSAARLTEREAAQLAVSLPNPIRRDAGDPGPGTSRLASRIETRMRRTPASAAACLRR